MGFDDIITVVKENSIERVDLRAVDLQGRLRRLTLPVSQLVSDLLVQGVGADASNYGLAEVECSDLVLVPDPSTARIDPTRDPPTLVMIADMAHPGGELVAAAPRTIARRAEQSLRKRGVADRAQLAVELEFYLFESVLVEDAALTQAVSVLPAEGEASLNAELTPSVRTAYHAGGADDKGLWIRDDVTGILEHWDIPVRYHHHEAGSLGHMEVELGFGGLVEAADWTVLARDLVSRLAAENGLTACFLPKPLHRQPGSGLHVHQYLLRGDNNVFAGEGGLSEVALQFIGGLLAHGCALAPWVAPSTNSYRRLLPGFEAPVHLAFGPANRTAAVRIPGYVTGASAARFEFRVPDPTCNPYLGFAACLMAGLDGVQRGIDPQREGWGPWSTDLSSLPREQARKIESLPRTLEEALTALEEDRAFLSADGVFPERLVDLWLSNRREDAQQLAARPHPYEFRLHG